MEKDYSYLLDDIRKIAREAGDKIMGIYRNLKDEDIELKKDDSPLTIADKASHNHIVKNLKEITPDIPIISEEHKNDSYAERAAYSYCWIVDPLDGTKEFIKKNGEFTVNIALLYKGTAVLGVVTAPDLDMEYFAYKGKGAFKAERDKNQERIQVRGFNMNDKGLVVVSSRSHMNTETSEYLGKLNEPVLISKGSSLKFMVIASGEADLYPRIAPTMEWDTAAAQIVLEEAGGAVEIYGKNSPVKYNKENLLNPYFIARGRLNVH